MKAFVLAGGLATRLGSLGEKTPKPLLEIKGRAVIECTLESLAGHGVDEAVISVGHLGEKIEQKLGSGEQYGLKISYSKEDRPLGTGGALANAREFFNHPFLATNGDELKEVDYSKLMEKHMEFGGIATIALLRKERPKQFGVVELEGNRISRFHEKPEKDTKEALINVGSYAFNPGIFSFIPEERPLSLERQVLPVVAEKGLLFGLECCSRFFALDSLELYERALKEFGGR